MAVDTAALRDLRNFIKKRVGFMRYRVGENYYTAPITNAELLETGVVRVTSSIVPETEITIDRIELYSKNGDLWAHQDATITIDSKQTGVLYWFDFTIKEGVI